MEPALIIPLVLHSLACSGTPGPNNIMLASSGLAFGFRRTGSAPVRLLDNQQTMAAFVKAMAVLTALTAVLFLV